VASLRPRLPSGGRLHNAPQRARARGHLVREAVGAFKKAWVDFILLFVMFFPSCVLIIYTTWPFLKHSLQVNEGSPDPGSVPFRWALKSVIMIGFSLLILQGISQAIKNFYWAMGWEEPDQRVQEIH